MPNSATVCKIQTYVHMYSYPIIRVCILYKINGKNTRLLHTPELCELASPNWCNHQRSDPHGNQRHFQREIILLLLLITLNWLVTSHHHQAVTHSLIPHSQTRTQSLAQTISLSLPLYDTIYPRVNVRPDRLTPPPSSTQWAGYYGHISLAYVHVGQTLKLQHKQTCNYSLDERTIREMSVPSITL